jgi:hypothetical protein
MPETRLERAIFVLGLVAIAALAFAVVRLRHHAVGPAAGVSTRTVRAGATATKPFTTVPASTTAPAHTTAKTAVDLVLTASGAGSWLEVRAGSATGAVLYAGTLSSGAAEAFRRPTIWVRFGAARNVSARLNGQPVPLPGGTYDAVFNANGFRKAP